MLQNICYIVLAIIVLGGLFAAVGSRRPKNIISDIDPLGTPARRKVVFLGSSDKIRFEGAPFEIAPPALPPPIGKVDHR
jgi:hypothetical protein